MDPIKEAIRKTRNYTVVSLSAFYLLINYRSKQILGNIRVKNILTRRVILPNLFIVFSLSLFVVGIVQSLKAWDANTVAYKHAASLVSQANKKDKHAAPIIATTSVPSTVQPSANTLASYVVAPNMPRYLIIPKLGVDARILSVGVNAQGALETPGNVFDTAWYNKSSLPGQPGAMLIDGHVSSWTAHGVFYGLDSLSPGDKVEVKRGDGITFTYSVVSRQVYKASNVNMSAALSPINPGTPGLNLISCTGDVISGTSDFNERIVIFTSLDY